MTVNTSYDEARGCCATLARAGKGKGGRRVVLGGSSEFAAKVADHVRRKGWHVHVAGEGDDVRRATRRLSPHAVILPVEQGDESGYLTCAKLVHDDPTLRVVLVAGERTADAERFADFVGASAVVAEADGVCRADEALAGCVNG